MEMDLGRCVYLTFCAMRIRETNPGFRAIPCLKRSFASLSGRFVWAKRTAPRGNARRLWNGVLHYWSVEPLDGRRLSGNPRGITAAEFGSIGDDTERYSFADGLTCQPCLPEVVKEWGLLPRRASEGMKGADMHSRGRLCSILDEGEEIFAPSKVAERLR